jgi:hypothetical protein
MQWWEKTVEYSFVLAAFQSGKCDLAAPLSGKHERLAGDTVFGVESSLVLIEFKRDEAEIPTELSLFHDYEQAKLELFSYEHHQIIFGAPSETEPATLNLVAETYFSARRRASAVEVLNYGIDGVEFRKYVEALARLKKQDGRSTTGHVSPEALSKVMSVSRDGTILGAKPLFEYAPDLFPVDVFRDNHTPQPPVLGHKP